MEPTDTESEQSAPAGTRAQHLVYTLPQDWGAIPAFLAASFERLDPNVNGLQLLVVTPDADTALAVAEFALTRRSGSMSGAPLVLPIGRPERAARQLAARQAAGSSPAVVAGTPAALAALVRGATLKLDTVRTLALAWVDEILAGPEAADLEAVLAEVPRESARILVATQMTDAVEALAERALWRARRIDGVVSGPPIHTPIAYVLTAATGRRAALRRVLDELDPVTATVVVSSDASERDVQHTRAALGYPGSADAAARTVDANTGNENADAASASQERVGVATAALTTAPAAAAAGAVTVVRDGAPPPHVALAVLYDAPVTREALDRVLAGHPGQIVALLQPRQLEAFRTITGGAVRALSLGDAARRARARDEALRSELRAELERGLPPREVIALEPLLADFDAADLAAAAVRILERERTRRAVIAAPAPALGAGPAAPPPKGAVRLFFTVGSRDEVRAGDLVGAIAGEAGITSDKIGRIEIRDSFSLVEVDAATAERVLAKVNGTMIRGRRVVVRPEREAPAGGAGRGGAGGTRGDARGEGRGDPRGPRPPRSNDRGDRPDRGDRADRGPRPERPAFGTGGPSAGRSRSFDARSDGPRGFGAMDDRGVGERAEQRGEWAERAERLRRARPNVGREHDAPRGGAGHAQDEITES